MMRTALVLAFVALLVPGMLGLPLGDSLLNRMARDAKEGKEEPTETPPPKKPQDSVVQHMEPLDEDQTPGAFQGDMMLTEDQQRQIEEAIDDQKAGRKKRKAVINQNARWTNNIIPYEISPSSSGDSEVIRAAMDHWEEHTCLRFEPRTSSHAGDLGHSTYLSFIKGGGCWSYVGKVFNGEQQISIGNGCAYLGIVAHEIGHAIGFHHEQSRPDRDDYINVHYENIQSGFEGNFDRYEWTQVTTGDVGYDIGSVMHYGSHGFSSNGLPTITTIDPLDMHRLGNRAGLSAADIALANLIYECDNECSDMDECLNGGYHDTDCNCVCPPGYSGDLCQDGNGPTTTPPCIQRLTDTQGEFTSPNHPSNYDNDQECMYLIEGPPGSTIELTFVDFDIETESLCRYDAVEVRKDDINSIGEKFCGNTLPAVQISSGNRMLVSFTSDYSVTKSGFRATYVIQGGVVPTTNPPVVGTCGGNFVGNQGSLASPNYPNNYDNNLRCVYEIEVEAGRRVELIFRDFSLEDQSSCRWDSLELDLGDGVKIPMRMCGSDYPAASLVSIGNKMELTLISDRSVTDRGFHADYRVIDL